MAVNNTPLAWLGEGYTLSGSVIGLTTATHAGTTLGTVTADAATNVLTNSDAHNLSVANRVRFTTTTTLPAGLSLATDYYVLTVPSTTTLTVSASRGGAVVDITTTGTGTHTMLLQGALSEVTDTEAAVSTGDMRKILFGLNERLWLHWNSLATADKPTNMILRKTSRADAETNEIINTYTAEFVLQPTGLEVSDE